MASSKKRTSKSSTLRKPTKTVAARKTAGKRPAKPVKPVLKAISKVAAGRATSRVVSRKGSAAKVRLLPPRDRVPQADTWDLSSLFKSDSEWEAAFTQWEAQIGNYANYVGKLGESAEMLAACLRFDAGFDRAGERLAVYAYLKTAEDQASSPYQRMKGRYQHVATKAAEASSYIRPEVMAIDPARLAGFLADPVLAEWKLVIDRLVRYRPHTLSAREEQILAMQGQVAQTASQVFGQLSDADLKWPLVRNEKGEQVELSHSTFSALLHSPKREVRAEAFHTYYKQYDAHKNTIAATLAGSVQRDVYYARVREYPSALESALFPDNVPVSVYDNLISSVRAALPSLHRYYDVRRRKMKLRDIHHYDTYVPILASMQRTTPWEEAVKLVLESLQPLGDEYCSTLAEGLTTARWCDRYPNQGKRSGAFSSGSFDGAPYILMNYQPDVLDHVFTLTHEAGHSMHSWYSARNQPYQYYDYTIFVAEVASTFNEQLLGKHLMDKAQSDKERAYLINKQLDEIRGTIFRQTMFAEFEKRIHAIVEGGDVLTVDRLRAEYRELLTAYFGPEFTIDPELELECLRIPHFYRAFYVYKYATGLSASIALSQRVLHGGPRELGDYLTFLKGGNSKYPLDLLRDAGVDMEKPDAVNAAMNQFDRLVTELDELI